MDDDDCFNDGRCLLPLRKKDNDDARKDDDEDVDDDDVLRLFVRLDATK